MITFFERMNEATVIADISIYKYIRAVNTISNKMLEQGLIYKSLLEMSSVEFDIAMQNILNNGRV